MKSRFGRLVIEYIDGHEWQLVVGLWYIARDGEMYTIPAGYQTDGASSPWWTWFAVPQWGKWGKPAVLHDYLYATKQVTKKTADRLFLEAMKDEGVNWRRYPMYWAVRIFGGPNWKRRTV